MNKNNEREAQVKKFINNPITQKIAEEAFLKVPPIPLKGEWKLVKAEGTTLADIVGDQEIKNSGGHFGKCIPWRD